MQTLFHTVPSTADHDGWTRSGGHWRRRATWPRTPACTMSPAFPLIPDQPTGQAAPKDQPRRPAMKQRIQKSSSTKSSQRVRPFISPEHIRRMRAEERRRGIWILEEYARRSATNRPIEEQPPDPTMDHVVAVQVCPEAGTDPARSSTPSPSPSPSPMTVPSSVPLAEHGPELACAPAPSVSAPTPADGPMLAPPPVPPSAPLPTMAAPTAALSRLALSSGPALASGAGAKFAQQRSSTSITHLSVVTCLRLARTLAGTAACCARNTPAVKKLGAWSLRVRPPPPH